MATVNTPSPRAEEYTIAWICALPIATVASIGMLDEKYQFISQRPSDHNLYNFGRIASHNVVIVSPPAESFGKASIARVVADTLTTFPFVRFALSVGIGGGVPSDDHDVRLGDVVVGMSSGMAGGIVQYDIGRAITGDQFRYIASSPNLSMELRSAVLRLRSRHHMEESALSKYLAEMIDRNARLESIFVKPDAKHDLFFEAAYPHQRSDRGCSSCDASKTISRLMRNSEEPIIHYGLIASTNRVLKDGQMRDQLRRDYDILCIEMEAAGIQDMLPCLVVRGICDYSDSHNNEIWQAYAAGAAAAYAKELLSVMLSSQEPSKEHSSKKVGFSARFSPRDRLFLVPFNRNRCFTGREDLIFRIDQLLHSHYCVLLHGPAGVGKTEIAAEYAYRVRERDSESHILWLYASTAEQFSQGCKELCRMLHLTYDTNPEFIACERLFTWLRKQNERWLLLIDDVADSIFDSPIHVMIGELVKDLSAVSRPDKLLLFTTRDPNIGNTLHLMQKVGVPELSPSDATSLLRALLKDRDDNPDFETVAPYFFETLGYSALAITQAAAYMNQSSTSLKQYLEAFLQAQPSFVQTRTDHLDSDVASRALGFTLEFTLEALRKQQPNAVELLSLLAMFETNRFPEYLLQVPESSDTQHLRSVQALLEMSLLERSSDENAYVLHSLVQRYLHQSLRKAGREEFYSTEALKLLADRFPGSGEQSRDICESLLPMARAVLQKDLRRDSSLLPRAELLFKIGSFELESGDANSALEKITEAHETFQKMLGEDADFTVTSLNLLAVIVCGQAKFAEASDLYTRLLASKNRMLGNDHPETLRVMNTLALVLFAQGKLSNSEDLLLKALTAYERVVGPEHPNVLSIMSNLASVYEAQGRYSEAEQLYHQTVEGCKKVLGMDHPDTLASINSLVSTLVKQAKYNEALELAREVLEISLVALGDKHPDTLASLNNLALILGDLSRYDEAERVNKQALQLYEVMLGKHHPARLTSLHNLARIYQLQGKWEDSAALYLEEMTIAESVLEEDDEIINSSRSRLAEVLEAQGKLEEAALLLEKACEVKARVLGEKDLTTVECREHCFHLWEKIRARRQEQHDPAQREHPILEPS